ncbi:MAG: patatin-like phospholipase family protein [Blastocatellia bacterium]
MKQQSLVAFLPLALLFVLAGWGLWMKKACKFQMPKDPVWPFADSPGLALELAGSLKDVDAVLGEAHTDVGQANRKAGALSQKLDFGFIPLYVLFFAAAALPHGWSRAAFVIALALLTAIADLIEDGLILRMLRGAKGLAARPFGLTKWFFYFATLAAEGSLFFFESATSSVRAVVGMILGAALIAIALGGMFSTVKGNFAGIKSATNLSALGLLALALLPLIALYPFSWRVTAEYAVLLRVPLLLGVILFALPFIAFFSGAKTLLRGLFDLTALSLFVVTLAALAAAGMICMTASIVLGNAWLRFGLGDGPLQLSNSLWLIIMLVLSLPVIAFSVGFSARQGCKLSGLLIAALCGIGVAVIVALALIAGGANWVTSILPFLQDPRLKSGLSQSGLFMGYVQTQSGYDPWPEHLHGLAAFLVTLFLYASVGIYGWWQLGKKRTVPALGSALMLMLMIGWMLSGLAFFFDAWHIPTLLIVAAVGFVTAQSSHSDHFYHLRQRQSDQPAPEPARTIAVANQPRVIVVAANGGGIQAGAWTARVLDGLCDDNPADEPTRFQKSLRMISSVSGSSVGSACFVDWLANPQTARPPNEAAAKSSLDEVAWGLVWPDFLRSLIPWLLGGLIGRGRALEKAWLLNSALDLTAENHMDQPLSNWNEAVANGKLPAVVMNATIAEAGERLLLATTRLSRQVTGRARIDATQLHTINGQACDVAVVTAARLSASFPYVTPAARADGPGPQPHVVDGGYYDNYGMATLVEWLDEALAGAGNSVESVLVIQIHGAPVDANLADERHAKERGWFYQAFAPLTTLAAVRGAGQIAHNDIELEFLQQKWAEAKIPIHTVTFEFHNPDAPLSWHLTRSERNEIQRAWQKDMGPCRQLVKQFLDGNVSFNCGCLTCASAYRTHAR